MIGIIYKLTIICGGIKKDGHFPFYIGQHYEISNEKFLSKKRDNYYGSGSIWHYYIMMLKKRGKRVKWRNLIKREILYSKENISQRALDVLEKYYIKREKAHYSYGLGGCNILWGTANKFGAGSPAKDPKVAKKISRSIKEFYKTKRGKEVKKQLSEYWGGDRIRGEKNPNFGHYWTDEMKRRASEQKRGMYIGKDNPNFGNYWTDKQKAHLSERLKEHYKNHPNPMQGRVRITNGIVNTTILRGEELPSGFWYGLTRRKK